MLHVLPFTCTDYCSDILHPKYTFAPVCQPCRSACIVSKLRLDGILKNNISVYIFNYRPHKAFYKMMDSNNELKKG